MSALTRITSAWAALTRADTQPSPPSPPAPRGDAWTQASGIGTARYDRTRTTTYGRGVDLYRAPRVLRDLYCFNWLVRRVVDRPVETALSKGIGWSIPDADTDTLAIFTAEAQRLGVLSALRRARQDARLWGGALVLVDYADAAPHTPAPGSAAIRTLHVVSRRWVTRSTLTGWDTDPSAPYTVSRIDLPSKWHPSRVVRIDGAHVDYETWRDNGGWGAPVLNDSFEDIRGLGISTSSLRAQLFDAIQKVYKIRGLHAAIQGGNRQFIKDWMYTMEAAAGALRAVALDAEAEDFQYKGRPFKDSVDLHNALLEQIAAAVDMPATVLLGRAPSGLSTDDASGYRLWLDRIDSQERPVLEVAALDLGARITAQATQARLRGAPVAIQWAPLWQESAKTQAETRKLNAETDAIYAAMLPQTAGPAIVSARFGGETYGAQLKLDVQAIMDAVPDTDTGADPLEILQQLRLAYPSGILTDPVMGPLLLEMLGLPPLGDDSRDYLLMLLGRITDASGAATGPRGDSADTLTPERAEAQALALLRAALPPRPADD